MFPYIMLFDKFQIPLYGPVFFLGFLIAYLIGLILVPKYGISREDFTFGTIYSGIGLLVGAKVLYFLTKLPLIISSFDTYLKLLKLDWVAALNFAFGGLVFYGGLIGAVLGMARYCYHFKIPFVPYMDIYAPLIPLIHGFGRIGCFLAGCCYGIEYHGFGSIQFPYNELVPELSAVPRVPVQLIEAGMNFGLSAVLFLLMKSKKMKPGQMLGIYVIYYTVVRYLLEMLRGDTARGEWGFISTSQIISILLFPIGVLLVSGKWIPKLLKKSARKT